MSQLKIKAILSKYEAEKSTSLAELEFWMNTPSNGEFMDAIDFNIKKLANANQMINTINAAFSVAKPQADSEE